MSSLTPRWTLLLNFLSVAYSIFFTDNLTGWAAGSNGTILKTNNGGTPVELLSFTCTVENDVVDLIWVTATETNNSGFEILCKIYAANGGTQNNNEDWNKIGFVPGHGTTTKTQHYSFTDNEVKPGKYQYKLKQIDYDGTFDYTQIVEVVVTFADKFSLFQNYPNPFNPTTKIKFEIPGQARNDNALVTLKVYDILGKEVATLVNEEKSTGEYEVEFSAIGGSASGGDVSILPSGIYFYQMKAGSFIQTNKMVLMK